MNLSDMTPQQIMKLPDHLFGNRFIVGIEISESLADTYWDIAETALPDYAVLWSFGWELWNSGVTFANFRLALGDQLPTTTGQMDGLTPLLSGVGNQGSEPRAIQFGIDPLSQQFNCKTLINAQGRRPILEMTNPGQSNVEVRCLFVFSSLPKAVPDEFVRML